MNKYRAYDKLEKQMRRVVSLHWQNDTLVAVKVEGEAEPLLIEGRFIVEQYTGIKGKNGVEIASGDIVKRRTANYEKQVFEDEYGVVKYEKGSFYVDFRGDIDNLMLRYGEPEVIGNIHENAGLLEEK